MEKNTDRIEDSAFFSASFTGELVIPKGIESIGVWAFERSSFDSVVNNSSADLSGSRIKLSNGEFYKG